MTRRTGPTQKVRDLVHARDESRCIVCGETYLLQVHHRRARAAGGTRRPETNGPANLVVVCLEHHVWLEKNRDLARQRGYLIRQHTDPQDVPLVHCGGRIVPVGEAFDEEAS